MPSKLSALRSAWHVARSLTKRVVIRGYHEYCDSDASLRALLSYTVQPLLLPRRYRQRVMFSPFGIAQEIPRVLNEMGYVVDIVNYDNTRWQPGRRYDLFIGHGGINFERLAATMGPDTKRIYFASGIHCKQWNLNTEQRLREFAARTGRNVPSERTITFDEEPAYTLADGIIYLGNSLAGESYAEFSSFGLNNSFYPVTWDGWRTKDFAEGRKHFLFYQGHGSVHKGLDRLIEAFEVLPQLHLHICQKSQPEFMQLYDRLLRDSPNIHLYKFIGQRSTAFYELAGLCNWVVSATCAEGQPGSIVEMMAHGLIPILPDTANIDLGSWGIRLTDCSPSQIAETCAEASEIATGDCQQMAEAVVAETREQYSIECFRRNFQAGVQAIVDSAEPQSRRVTRATLV